MTDQTEEQTATVTAAGGEDSGSNIHQITPPPPPEIDEVTSKMEKMSSSFSIWPPTQRTRDAVIKRLIQTLSEKSILSDRYGEIPPDEAAGVARRIEEEAFNAAANAPPSNGEDDGIEILQFYSKEISKRMLDIVKSRSGKSSTVSSNLDNEDVQERSIVETQF